MNKKEIISGIYKIINNINKKYYVGSAFDILNQRWPNHRSSLRWGKHHNGHLQRAWKKYGENSFEFVVVEKLINPEESELRAKEQNYLDIAKTEKNICYNIKFIAIGGFPNLGPRIISEESRKKRSEALRGKTAWNKGKSFSMETRLKMKNSAHQSGINNNNSDDNIYIFNNTHTQETFIGTRFNFRKSFLLNPESVSRLIQGRSRHNCLHGWKLISTTTKH